MVVLGGEAVSYQRNTPVDSAGVERWGPRDDRLYRGTSPIRKRPTPCDPPTTPGIGLRPPSLEQRMGARNLLSPSHPSLSPPPTTNLSSSHGGLAIEYS